MSYTAEEYMDMIVCYEVAGENAYSAARLYAERFPNRRHPSRFTILRCMQRGKESRYLLPQHRVNAPVRRDINVDEEVLHAFEENPGNSVRHVANTLGVPRSTVHQILKENGLHPFHYQRVQQLLARDEQQRIYFCEGFLAQCRQDISFPDRILWTDEATFTPNGIFNSRNFVLWQNENPHAIRQCTFQYRWSINVWAGVMANRVIGPYFLPPRLDGQTYAEFIENELPNLLEDVPLRDRETMMFQHDGAPAHYRRQVREILNARFPDKWIGRGGPIIWPARSPDLNVLDYFVWGYIKTLVEHTRDRNENEAREAIVAAFNNITLDMAQRATQQIVRRAELCLQVRGKHFEHLLH